LPNWNLQIYCIHFVTKATCTLSSIKYTFKSTAPLASSQSGYFTCANTVCPANRSMFGNYALQGYYAERSGNSLLTFMDNLSVPSLRIKNPLRQIFSVPCILVHRTPLQHSNQMLIIYLIYIFITSLLNVPVCYTPSSGRTSYYLLKTTSSYNVMVLVALVMPHYIKYTIYCSNHCKKC
jgi:hypothetical protein